MAVISVPPGKSGKITFGANALYLKEWEMGLEIDNDLVKHFEQTADANSIIFAACVTGHATGEATVRGNFDNTAAAYLPSSKSIWLNAAGTGWLGYTSSVGYNVSFTIIGIRTLTAADRPAGATYEARVRITAAVFNAAGP